VKILRLALHRKMKKVGKSTTRQREGRLASVVQGCIHILLDDAANWMAPAVIEAMQQGQRLCALHRR